MVLEYKVAHNKSAPFLFFASPEAETNILNCILKLAML